MQRAHQRGTKILFVTHDLGQARRLADDVLFQRGSPNTRRLSFSSCLHLRRRRRLSRRPSDPDPITTIKTEETQMNLYWPSACYRHAGCGADVGFPGLAEDDPSSCRNRPRRPQPGLHDALLPLREQRPALLRTSSRSETDRRSRTRRTAMAMSCWSTPKHREEKLPKGGVERFDVMYNDFHIVGLPSDPPISPAARCHGAEGDRRQQVAVRHAATTRARIRPRLKPLKQVGVDPKAGSGAWYRETGFGHGRDL